MTVCRASLMNPQAMTVNMTMTKRKMSDLLEPKQQRRVKLWKEMREEEADILIATLQKNDPVVSVCFDSSANMTSSKAPTSRDLNKKAYNQANLGGGAVRQNGLLGQHIPLQQQPLRNRLRVRSSRFHAQTEKRFLHIKSQVQSHAITILQQPPSRVLTSLPTVGG